MHSVRSHRKDGPLSRVQSRWDSLSVRGKAFASGLVAAVVVIASVGAYVAVAMTPSAPVRWSALPAYQLMAGSRPLRPGRAAPAGKQAALVRTRPRVTSGSTSPTKTASKSATPVKSASIGVRESLDAGSQLLTFSEFPEGTEITGNYSGQGVIFASAPGHAAPFISSDASNPTSPVLSGSPLFSGNVYLQFVIPGTQTLTRVSAISLDVGYIDNPGSVEVLAFSPGGIEVMPANDFGIVHIESTVGDISAVAVVQSDTEPAGFAIDNVSFTPGTTPATGLAGGPLIASESNGLGNAAETLCECGVRFGGDPVNTLTGNFTESYRDVSVVGAGPVVALDRTYNSEAATVAGLFGYGWRSSWEAALSLDGNDIGSHANVTLANGATAQFTLTGLGWFAAPRVTAKLADQTDGSRVLTFVDGTSYTFDSGGQLIKVGDRNGRTVAITRPDATSMIATDDSGRLTRLTLAGGHVTEATDPVGAKTVYAYDGSGNLTGVTDPLGRTTTFGYDGSHRLTAVTTPGGRTTQNQYSAAGQVTKQIDPAGGATTFEYRADGVTRTTEPDGRITDQTYAFGLMTKLVVGVGTPEAQTYAYEYDTATAGRIKDTAPDGTVVTRTFDAGGNLLSSTDGIGRTTSYTYNTLNEPTSMTYPSGRYDAADYDSAGNLITSTADVFGLSLTTTFVRGQHGDLTDAYTPIGAHVSYATDAAGNVMSTQDADGNVATIERDALGRVVTTTAQADPAHPGAAGSRVTRTAYNKLSWVASTTAADGGVTAYAYDADGRLTTTTAPQNRVTSEAYNDRGDLVSETAPDGGVTTMTYDPMGRMLSRTDPTGATVSYGYDALGRAISETDGLGRVTASVYDDRNRLASRTPPSGAKVTYGYDRAGQLKSMTYAAGTPNVAYTYTVDGQRATEQDGTGTTTYQYDGAGRLTGLTNGAGAAVSYHLDADGRATSITYPNGQNVTRTFTNSGGLASVTDWLGHTTTFAPDPFGETSRTTFGNGVVGDRAYTVTGQPARLDYRAPDNSAVASFTATVAGDGTSLVSRLQATGAVTEDMSITYGATNRVTAFAGAAVAYDVRAGLLTRPDGATQTIDKAGQVTKAVGGTVPNGVGAAGLVAAEPGKTVKPVLLPDGRVRLTAVQSTVLAPTKSSVSLTLPAASAGQTVLVLIGGQAKAASLSFTVTGTSLSFSRSGVQRAGADAAEVWRANGSGQPSTITVSTSDSHGYATVTAVVANNVGAVSMLGGVGAKSVPSTAYTAGAGALVLAVGALTRKPPAVRPRTGTFLLNLKADTSQNFAGYAAMAGPLPVKSRGTIGLLDAATQWAQSVIVMDVKKPAPSATPTPSASPSPSPSPSPSRSVSPSASSSPSASPTVSPSASASGSPSPSPTASPSPTSSPSPAASPSPTATRSPSPTPTAGSPSPSGPAQVAYAYSADGYRSSATTSTGGGHDYAYDAEGRLVKVSDKAGATIATYAYDGDGLRRGKHLASGRQYAYAYDQRASMPLLIDDGVNSYIYGPDNLPIEQISNSDGGTTFLVPDTRGSIRILTDAVGNVKGTAGFGLTGVPTGVQGSTSDFGFDGQVTDAETGFQYLRARYYDPVTASFLTPDPLRGLTGSPYGFAGGNPVSFADPSGLFFISCDSGIELLDALGSVSEGIEQRASVLGRILSTSGDAQARSYAARLLRPAGQLSNNGAWKLLRSPALKFGLPIIGGELTTIDDLSQGKGVGESIGEGAGQAAGSIGGGALGAAAGGAICGLESVATLGIGSVACPVLVGGLGIAGSWAGGVVGGFIGGHVGGWIDRWNSGSGGW